MKKINLLFYIIIVFQLTSCGTDDSEVNSDGGIVADFSFKNDNDLFTFTNLSEGATSYRWDFGDLSFYCEKENPTYRYTKVGGEIEVTLTAMNDEGQESYVTKTITAPIVLNVEIDINGGFEDWDEVPVLYEEADGVSVKKIKIWGKGDNVNVYLEGNTAMKMELVDIFINSDGNSSTGFLSWQWPNGSGADYLFEGPLLSNSWGGFYQHTDPAGGWGWAYLAGSGVNIESSGIVNLDATTNAIEFRIPKTQFGSLGSSIAFAFSEMTSGWAAVGSFPKVTATSQFVVYELPSETTSVCE
ncbi:MAG: PKD domain-containing protein [Algibacter sp.]|uniref:PKD domain-containing protein n=1 Tax=Algibacter sp. TaxID=1872428 RepID=UPI00329A0A64